VFKEKGKKTPLFTQSDYIEEIKIPCDVKGKTKAQKKIIYNIPAIDKPEKVGALNGLPIYVADLARSLSVSQSRTIFMIKYRLDLFIKHKSKTEFGQGNFVSFPIVIRQKAHVIPQLALIQEHLVALLTGLKPFDPHTVHPHVTCGICLNPSTGMIDATTVVEGGETKVMMPTPSQVY